MIYIYDTLVGMLILFDLGFVSLYVLFVLYIWYISWYVNIIWFSYF